jgi:hypothetical protein
VDVAVDQVTRLRLPRHRAAFHPFLGARLQHPATALRTPRRWSSALGLTRPPEGSADEHRDDRRAEVVGPAGRSLNLIPPPDRQHSMADVLALITAIRKVAFDRSLSNDDIARGARPAPRTRRRRLRGRPVPGAERSAGPSVVPRSLDAWILWAHTLRHGETTALSPRSARMAPGAQRRGPVVPGMRAVR